MVLGLLLLFSQSASQPKPIDPASWFSTNDYPVQAVRDEARGKVGYEVNVDASGKPSGCRIISSSGHTALDQATCKILVSRGRFEPANDHNGDPIAGTYRGNLSWHGPDRPSRSYHAITLNFADDPGQPNCIVQVEGRSAAEELSCASMLNNEELMKRLSSQYRQVTFFLTSTPGDAAPYPGEAKWGERLSYMASDQYYREGASFPFACVSVAAEGWESGRDACAGFPGDRNMSDTDKANAKKLRSETSMYGFRR